MILITGAGGKLGCALQAYCLRNEIRVLGLSKTDLDIRNTGWVTRYMASLQDVNVTINCAAILSGEAQKDRHLTWETNVAGTENLALACRLSRTRLVYISSEYVFSGESGNYSEHHDARPVNYYGATKLAGEESARLAVDHLILRVPFRAKPWTFPTAYEDQFTSARWMHDVIPDIVRASRSKYNGVLHIGGPRRSVLDMAREACPGVQPASRKSWTQFALPEDTSLDSSRWAGLIASGEM